MKLACVKPDSLYAYVDVATGERSSTLTPGGLGRLIGRRLKFDAADPAQGVFFLSLADGSATQVELVGENLPSKQIFGVPALPAGDYELEVRSTLNSGEELRKGRLKATLTVA